MGRLSSIDLFAGAGGLALGVHQAGFVHLALIENNKYACESLELNRAAGVAAPRWPVFQRDVRAVDYRAELGDDLCAALDDKLRSAIDQTGELDLLAAGAPCQPFSFGGEHGGNGDDRNMFPFVFEAIRSLRPRSILIENVYGLKRPNFQPYYEYILLQLEMPFITPRDGEDWLAHKERLLKRRRFLEILDPRETYCYRERVLNSADYGTPQIRKRLFMVAFRRDLPVSWEFPLGEHSEGRLLYEQYVSGEYWWRHRLPPQRPPEYLVERVRNLASSPPAGKPWRTLRDALQGLPEPVEGANAEGWDFHVGIPNARLYRNHTGNDLDRPAKTIKAGSHGNPGGEHIIRRDDGSIRYMTVRECARVQDFPDDYRFAGPRSQAIRQIGNAVPVRLAEALARSLRRALEEASPPATPEILDQAASGSVG